MGTLFVKPAMPPAQFAGADTKSATRQIRLPAVKVGINRKAPTIKPMPRIVGKG